MRSFSFDGDGLRFMPYPESFSGASMQFFAYYCPGKGGLYFAADDPSLLPKWLNFYRMNGSLEASLMYGWEDIGAGKGAEAPFRFVVKTFAGDDWYDAADIYKTWAVKQSWCSQGTLEQRGDAGTASWLLKKVGAVTFGIDASHDRTLWIRRYRQDIGSPLFHILGPDWPKVDQNYYNSVPGGMADWFPTRFSRANLDLIRSQGDYVAPFEFDFLVDPRKSDAARLRANLEIYPTKPRSADAYSFTMLCPVPDFTQTLHVERDVRVLEESGVDSIYYDISANNLIKTCLSPDHGHPVGGGREITEAYKKIYADTRAALSAKAGRYVPLGTEMMCEVFLPELDYYQARAWAQPSSAFEMWPIRSLLKSGQAEAIPLFTYVYHEYGPVRLDGWGKLVAETGELFYNIAAKTYLWGGLYELNEEYSPQEAIDGVENSPAEHYFKFDPQGYAYDPERALYVARFAALRTGAGNPYLAYGVMQKPPTLSPTDTRMSWFHYNSNQSTKEYRDRGSIVVPGVVSSAWRHGSGAAASYALFLANTEGKEVKTDVRIDRDLYGITGVIASVIFMFLLNYRAGIVNEALRLLGAPRTAFLTDPLLAVLSIAIAALWMGFGYASLIMYAGLLNIPQEYYEAAAVDGAGSFTRLLRITLPSMRNIFILLCITLLTGTVQIFDLPFLMTGGGPVNKTLSPIMFLYNSFRSLDKTMGYTIAGALLMMIAITVVNSIVFTVIRSQKSMDA
jgi:hypothetical protein